MFERQLSPLAQSLFIAVMFSLVAGTMISLADFGPASLTEGYQAPNIPARDQLQQQLPNAPTIPTPDAATLRQAGSRQLQQFNPDAATDHNAIRDQLSRLSDEIAHPNNNGSSDPLGNNVATGENAQSTVSSGQLSSGSLAAEPRASGIGATTANRFGQDALNSWYNSLAATLVLRAEIVTKQTQKLADKLDEINTIHQEMNRSWQDLNSTANTVLQQLPTNPGA